MTDFVPRVGKRQWTYEIGTRWSRGKGIRDPLMEFGGAPLMNQGVVWSGRIVGSPFPDHFDFDCLVEPISAVQVRLELFKGCIPDDAGGEPERDITPARVYTLANLDKDPSVTDERGAQNLDRVLRGEYDGERMGRAEVWSNVNSTMSNPRASKGAVLVAKWAE